MAQDYLKQLDQLAPEARRRVEGILKSSIERELASGVAAGAQVAAKEFSKGWFFSRSRPSGELRPEEEFILQNATALDDAAFSRFAERLVSLKALKDK